MRTTPRLARALTVRRNRALVTFLAIAGAAFLLTGPVLGQPDADPAGEVMDAQCYGHHFEEGFRSMDLFPLTITEVERGSTFTFELTMVNPWLHEILQPSGFVDISGIPGASFPGAQEPEFLQESGALVARDAGPREAAGQETPLQNPAGESTAVIPFTVSENATDIDVRVRGDAGVTERNVWSVAVVAPSGDRMASGEPAFTRSLREEGPYHEHRAQLSYANVSQGGLGEWSVEVTYVRGVEPEAEYEVDVGVYYNLSQSSEIRVTGPDRLGPGDSHTFSFDVIMPEEPNPEAALVYKGHVIAHYKHNDPNADDYGNFTKWNTLVFPLGDQTSVGQGVIMAGAPNAGPLVRAYGQILGFSASFLLLPALFLGGTFGRGSVLAFNKILRGARRRVLWHNATSYLLLIVSVLHMIVFLMENFWHWSYGAFWGGLSLAAMLSLALTGAFQKRFVAYWGFGRWRFVHFTLGMLVIAFVAVHLLADGSHLAPLREAYLGA